MSFSIKYDTIINSCDTLGANNYFPSFDHTEQAINAAPQWIFFLFLIILSIYIFVRTYYGVHFRSITMGVIAPKKSHQILRESNFFNRAPFLLFFLNYLILLALFITLFFYKSHIQHSQGIFLLLLKIVIMLSTIFLVRWIFIQFIGKLFKIEKNTSDYVHTTNLFQVVAGIILFPLLVIYIYSPEWISAITENIVIFSLIIIITFGIVKGLAQIIVQLSFSYFHIIFYLCSIEIASIFIVLNFRNWLFINQFF